MKFKITWWLLTVIVLFSVSRLYIFKNPPRYYSDVKADYERYANMWRYGLTPYRKHLYEYPPATIPLLSFPLTLDQAGYGKYYSNYRTQILVVDILFFVYLVWIIRKIPWLKNRKIESLLFYILLTTLAKDFFYEGIDLVFTATTVIAFTLPLAFKKDTFVLHVLSWVFFWLSTAIKFLTIPLVVPFFLMQRTKNLKLDILACFLGFIIVWGLPVGLYRSSLMVSFTYNNSRPIKYASFPAYVIRWVNTFSHSETQKMVAPDFPYEGPVSTSVTKIDGIVFPVTLLIGLIYMSSIIVQKQFGKLPLSPKEIIQYCTKNKVLPASQQVSLNIAFYLLFILILFITAKIFSQPFHIWYMPVLILFPFQSKKVWYWVIGLATLMTLLDMTTYLHLGNNFLIADTIEIALIRDLFRFIPMFIIGYFLLKEIKTNQVFNRPE